jgi:hypothetical protein
MTVKYRITICLKIIITYNVNLLKYFKLLTNYNLNFIIRYFTIISANLSNLFVIISFLSMPNY